MPSSVNSARRRRAWFGLIPVILIAQFGCTSDTVDASRMIITDSAGVSIVESTGPEWSDREQWTLSSSPIVEIGSDSEDAMHLLHIVNGVVRLQDGTIVVANAGTLELRMFDSTGASRGTAGRPGPGPGEFESMRALYHCAGDTLVVRQLQTLSVFDRGGSYIRTIADPLIAGTGMRQILDLYDDCSSFLMHERTPVPESAPHDYRQPTTLMWGTLTDGVRDTVVTFPGAEMAAVRHAGQTFSRAVPWGIQPVFTSAADRVYVGYGETSEVHVFDRQGRLQSIFRWSHEPQPVTGADRALFDERVDAFVRANPQAAMTMAPIGSFSDLPTVKPPYTDVLLDADGNLWVRQYPEVSTGWPTFIDFEPDQAANWWVFDPSGRLLGSVETPEGLRVVGIESDVLLGIWRDAVGVEHVRMYGLIK